MPCIRSTPCLESVIGWARSREPHVACNPLLRPPFRSYLLALCSVSSHPIKWPLVSLPDPVEVTTPASNGLHVTIVPDLIATLEYFGIKVGFQDNCYVLWCVEVINGRMFARKHWQAAGVSYGSLRYWARRPNYSMECEE